MQVREQSMTQQAFDDWINTVDAGTQRFEWLNGEVIDVPSNPFVSVIAARIIGFLMIYLLQSKRGGYVTGEGGGFMIDGQRFAPDVALVEHLPARVGYESVPPLLAVEVISDPFNNTEQRDLRRKLNHYMRAGVCIWIVDYEAQQVEGHRPDVPVDLYSQDDVIRDEQLLPGFALPVKDIFPPESDVDHGTSS